MGVLIYLGALLGGILLSFPWKPDFVFVARLAIVLFVVNCITAINFWVYYFFGIKNTTVLHVLGVERDWLSWSGDLVYGYLLGCLLFRAGYPVKVFSRVLWAASVATANVFFVATMGKIVNMTDMISFFHQSGYAVWFFYFIMAAETAGGIGILLHFRLRTGIAASLGLMLIMLGAVYTHWHNGDPFSDSYAAVEQLIGLSALLALYLRGRLLSRNMAGKGYIYKTDNRRSAL
jgi:putative oxidoreductase